MKPATMAFDHFALTDVTVRPARVGQSEAGAFRPLDSVYHHSSLPSMPHSSRNSRNASGTSMIAYTERMREISRARADFAANPPPECAQGVGLEVRANHIPKRHGIFGHGQQSSLLQRRRPLSLDELTGRRGNNDDDTEPAPGKATKRRSSSLPPDISSNAAFSTPKNNGDERVKVSFVSASDLFDLVDFSLRSKRSRHEAIKTAKMEESLKFINDHLELFQLSRDLAAPRPFRERSREVKSDVSGLKVEGMASPREGKSEDSEKRMKTTGERLTSVKEEESSDIPDDSLREMTMPSQRHKLRYRPSRAKRMKLHRSGLGVIPEDDMHSQSEYGGNEPSQDPSISHLQRGFASSSHSNVFYNSNLLTSSQTSQTADLPILDGNRILPSTTSLAAIKVSRKKEKSDSSRPASDIISQLSEGPRTLSGSDHHGVGASGKSGALNETSAVPRADDRDATSKVSDPPADKRELSVNPRDLADFGILRSEPLKPRNVQEDRSTKMSRAQTELPHARARARAQKKIRRLIFLRDYPDQSYCHR